VRAANRRFVRRQSFRRSSFSVLTRAAGIISCACTVLVLGHASLCLDWNAARDPFQLGRENGFFSPGRRRAVERTFCITHYDSEPFDRPRTCHSSAGAQPEEV